MYSISIKNLWLRDDLVSSARIILRQSSSNKTFLCNYTTNSNPLLFLILIIGEEDDGHTNITSNVFYKKVFHNLLLSVLMYYQLYYTTYLTSNLIYFIHIYIYIIFKLTR